MFCYGVQCVTEMRHLYLYRHQIIEQCYTVGVGSLPLVCLISAFSGMAIAIQTAYQMEAYVPDYMVGALMVRSVILVLSPILLGLVLAGRVGAGVASELGTMKVSEQVDALTSMAVDPVGYLMLPRMLAGVIIGSSSRDLFLFGRKYLWVCYVDDQDGYYAYRVSQRYEALF